ncbi:hypothetical protein [Nocardioides humi]
MRSTTQPRSRARGSRGVRAVVGLLSAVLVVGLVGSAPVAEAAPKAKPGRYAGNLLGDDGRPVDAEWIRFKVKKKKVVKLRSRVWLHCYTYPNSYSQLPVVFTMPKAKIKKGRVDLAWQESFVVDGEPETLEGRVQLRFKKNGTVTGQLSVDVANCASRLGDPPHWVKLRAKRK